MNRNRLLDVEFIQKKLDEGFQYTLETKGRDLVLVIGNTGVGKSTTCNYLLGYPMKEEKYKGNFVIGTVEESPIKIGHHVTAKTLYAKSFVPRGLSSLCTKNSHGDICLLDYPGFLGNGTIEEVVIESISTELAIRSARKIKGILILISLNILLETRVKELHELVKILKSLFKDPLEMMQYSLFIITKKHKSMSEAEARETTFGALTRFRKYCEEQVTFLRRTSLLKNTNLISSEGLTSVDYDMISAYFSAILWKPDNFVVINPLDKGESRDFILARINSIKPRRRFLEQIAKSEISLYKNAVEITRKPPLKPITINDFCFSEGNEDRVKFNKALYDRAREGNNAICKIRRCGEMNRKLHSEISTFHNKLSTLEKLKVNFEEEICKTSAGKSCHATKIFESVKILELIVLDNNAEIKSKEREYNKNDKRKVDLSEYLKSIDTDEPTVFIQKSICRNTALWKVLRSVGMKFEADTGDTDVRIIKVDKELENGKWVNENDRRENGIYCITYQSNYLGSPASASVKTYVKTKDEAGNKIRIENLKNDEHFLTEQQAKLKSEIAELVSINHALLSAITKSKFNTEVYEKDLPRKLEHCKKEIQRIKTQISEKEEERKQTKRNGMQYLEKFQSNRHKFDILISIASLLEFRSAIITNFISEYYECLTFIDNYKSSFSESDVNTIPYAKEKGSDTVKEKVYILKDPITGDEIKHLVVTAAGTAFDEHSLLEQFDNDNPLPFLFRGVDGSSEEIEYLSWQKVPDIQNYIDKHRYEKIYNYESVSSPELPLKYTGSEINKVNSEELQEQKQKLLKEIQNMEEELEVKRIDLERIFRQLESLQTEEPSEEPEVKEESSV